MSFTIIVKNYEHINRSLPNWNTPKGKYIRSKKQYEEEMARGGFIPYREVEPKESKWIPSADLKKTLQSVYAGQKGNSKPSDRLIDKMKEMGVNFNPKIMSNDLKGGID